MKNVQNIFGIFSSLFCGFTKKIINEMKNLQSVFGVFFNNGPPITMSQAERLAVWQLTVNK